jgi:hypothetical protein
MKNNHSTSDAFACTSKALATQFKPESRVKDLLNDSITYDIIYTLTASIFSSKFLTLFSVKLKQTTCGNPLTLSVAFDL